jgi:hypothetical protein
MNETKIIEFIFDKENGSISLVLNIWLLLGLIGIFILISWLIKKYHKSNTVQNDITPVKLKYSVGGTEIEYEITRNYQNIEIAHRIYIELITRKAALEIDKEKDVIIEIYNSWYTLFQITRDELKKIPGVLLLKNNTSESLVDLLSDILNKGLRPHLTEYQAKFRKWYNLELSKEENKIFSPQQIQSKYHEFDKLMTSMISVNSLLIEYSKQLKIIINGTKKNIAK